MSTVRNMLISFCIPIHNEEEILLKYIGKIQTGLTEVLDQNNFEIILVENGSTDKTPQLLTRIKDKNVQIISIKKKGQGNAYREGIKKAKGDYVLLTAIDIPFGFTDIENAKPYLGRYDIIFASKAHKKSKIYIPFNRQVASVIYRTLLKILFHVPVGDTQGSMLLSKNKFTPLLKYCDANDAFFTAQLAIYAKLFRLSIKEIPITHNYTNVTIRKSKYNIFRDGKIMFESLLREYFKIKKIQQEIKAVEFKQN